MLYLLWYKLFHLFLFNIFEVIIFTVLVDWREKHQLESALINFLMHVFVNYFCNFGAKTFSFIAVALLNRLVASTVDLPDRTIDIKVRHKVICSVFINVHLTTLSSISKVYSPQFRVAVEERAKLRRRVPCATAL